MKAPRGCVAQPCHARSVFYTFEMSSSVTDSNEEDKARKAQKEADAVLEAFLADTSFNEFEFLRWKNDEGRPKAESDAYQFARTVFPLLTRY